MARKKKSGGERFPLLIYKPLGLRWRSLGILLAVLSLVLWWYAPQLLRPSVGLTPLRHLALLPVFTGIVLTVYGLAARRMAYVRCYPKYMRIQTPFFPLAVSYKRVNSVRPVQLSNLFDSAKEKAARRSWPRAYWNMTAVAVELKSYPVSERWIRLWFDRYLFLPDMTGFVFLVDDWMGLSNKVESSVTAHVASRY